MLPSRLPVFTNWKKEVGYLPVRLVGMQYTYLVYLYKGYALTATSDLIEIIETLIVFWLFIFSSFYSIALQACAFVLSSIASAVFGVVITLIISMEIGIYHRSYGVENDAELAFDVIILILGVVAFVIGIWASKITLCCSRRIPQQQVSHLFYE